MPDNCDDDTLCAQQSAAIKVSDNGNDSALVKGARQLRESTRVNKIILTGNKAVK